MVLISFAERVWQADFRCDRGRLSEHKSPFREVPPIAHALYRQLVNRQLGSYSLIISTRTAPPGQPHPDNPKESPECIAAIMPDRSSKHAF
jgi:hypothetical protein